MFCTRVAGDRGTVWSEFDTVRVADASGTREIPAPEDLPLAPPDPPPGDLLTTAYDGLHAFGIDLVPYTRLCTTFLDLIEGRPVPADPPPATFADGVACQEVIDAIRTSAADGGLDRPALSRAISIHVAGAGADDDQRGERRRAGPDRRNRAVRRRVVGGRPGIWPPLDPNSRNPCRSLRALAGCSHGRRAVCRSPSRDLRGG